MSPTRDGGVGSSHALIYHGRVDEEELCAKRVGTVLCDKWTLERLVGIGGMAAVYVARHKIGRLDAIKILHPEYARTEQIRARFEQEAHVLNRFKHPGAVEVRDLETTPDGAPFIVMELLEGQSLADAIRARPHTVDEALRVADEVLDVIAAAHAQGIIHRDIKPDNLFVLPSGAIKVLDFGIAQLRSDGKGPLKTKTGTTLGTVAYMPPEQLKGLDIDARADVYSVGATMFRMLVGHTPHRADSDVELMMKVLTEPAPRLASVVSPVRADVAHIVDRSLAFDRDARYPDVRAMQSEVRAARAEQNAKMAEPMAPQSEVLTRMPERLSPLSPPVVSAHEPTMAAAPESALLREASPQSRLPTRSVEAISQPTHEKKSEHEMFGIPIVWLIGAAVVIVLAMGALVASLAIAALRHAEPSPASAQGANTAAAPPPIATTAPTQSSPDEDEHEEHHHGPPKGHPKHPH